MLSVDALKARCLDVELDGRFDIRERLLIAVAFTHYDPLQPESVGHMAVGALLHDDLDSSIHFLSEIYQGPKDACK